MFVAYPISLHSRVYIDNHKYFIVSEDKQFNMDQIFDTKIWAFEGGFCRFFSQYCTSWEGVDICNFHEYLFSDHMPIYCDLDGIRLVVSNNVSVKGSRGINYNQDKFVSDINLIELQRISDDILMPYFINVIKDLIKGLIYTESGNSLISDSVICEFNNILRETDKWKLLKKILVLEIK